MLLKVLYSLGKYHMGSIVVGAYYRPLDQEEEVSEAFYRQLIMIITRAFNHPDISWEDNTVMHKQFRIFLQSIDN